MESLSRIEVTSDGLSKGLPLNQDTSKVPMDAGSFQMTDNQTTSGSGEGPEVGSEVGLETDTARVRRLADKALIDEYEKYLNGELSLSGSNSDSEFEDATFEEEAEGDVLAKASKRKSRPCRKSLGSDLINPQKRLSSFSQVALLLEKMYEREGGQEASDVELELPFSLETMSEEEKLATFYQLVQEVDLRVNSYPALIATNQEKDLMFMVQSLNEVLVEYEEPMKACASLPLTEGQTKSAGLRCLEATTGKIEATVTSISGKMERLKELMTTLKLYKSLKQAPQ